MRSRDCDQPAPAHGGADCTDTVVSVSGPLGQQRRKCGEESCSQGKHGLYYLISSLIPKKSSTKCFSTLIYSLCLLILRLVDDPCPWLTPTDSDDVMECQDGTRCNGETMGWSCCKDHGGRAKCPANNPAMCAQPSCAAGGSDYCCYTEDGCKDYGGIRPCGESSTF